MKTSTLKINTSVGNKCMTALVMLDLSAVFDVIDYGILQRRLEDSFGITGSALTWIQSYMSDRSQCVAVGRSTSEGKCLSFGVLQGSVLGPESTVYTDNQSVQYACNTIFTITAM